ncbi:glycerophosphodiester phosphodiesterase [Propionibacteriaceae bacterium Y2011]|uniref:glycerophosphodiester phosphodiesterase n=1 Tax=Microlunatus sp. Y2014 TaxID=3418488 RepID=UPI003B4552A2
MLARDYPYFEAGFLAFAHRGGAELPANRGRENTLHAFGQAVELGYRYLETDVHATADGVLVAFHDDKLDRVTDGTGKIAELPWSEVSQAKIGGHDPIPRLVDVLVAFPDTRFNIDAKAAGAVDLLADTIEHLGVHERVCVSSFSVRRLLRLRSRLGRRVASSMSKVGVAYTRFLPFLPDRFGTTGQALQIPVATTVLGRRVTLVTEALVDRAHGLGKQVHVWTIDDPAEMVRLIDLGVDGIMTDRPDVLREVLVERGLWDQ